MIESAPRQKSALRTGAERAAGHPAGIAALLVLGIIAGSVGGYIVGHSNPRTFAGLGYYIGMYLAAPSPPDLEPFEQSYGRVRPPMLEAEDLMAVGETVNRQFSVLSTRSALPVMCGTSLGQPGTPNHLDLRYPATVFGVNAAQVSELIWPRADAASASATLHTLVFQAQICPELASMQASIATEGVRTESGLGDEYALFTLLPTVAGGLDAPFATVALVRVGADLIEIALTPNAANVPETQARCLQIAAAAASRATSN